MAVNTPAERVPSHGTDYFGQRYAFDLARLDPPGKSFSKHGTWKQFIGSVAAGDFFAWGEPVFAAFPGTVVAAGEDWPDRMSVNSIREIVRANLVTKRPAGSDFRPLLGNYVMVEGTFGIGLYAHLMDRSLLVRVGDRLDARQEIGKVGNSGNTTMPHLHFHLMDGMNPETAKGILCAFRNYFVGAGGKEVPVKAGVPGLMERFVVPPFPPNAVS